MGNAVPMSKQEILRQIDDDLYDAYCMPQHGLTPDWYVRYMDLKDAIERHFNEPLTRRPHEP